MGQKVSSPQDNKDTPHGEHIQPTISNNNTQRTVHSPKIRIPTRTIRDPIFMTEYQVILPGKSSQNASNYNAFESTHDFFQSKLLTHRDEHFLASQIKINGTLAPFAFNSSQLPYRKHESYSNTITLQVFHEKPINKLSRKNTSLSSHPLLSIREFPPKTIQRIRYEYSLSRLRKARDINKSLQSTQMEWENSGSVVLHGLLVSSRHRGNGNILLKPCLYSSLCSKDLHVLDGYNLEHVSLMLDVLYAKEQRKTPPRLGEKKKHTTCTIPFSCVKNAPKEFKGNTPQFLSDLRLPWKAKAVDKRLLLFRARN